MATETALFSPPQWADLHGDAANYAEAARVLRLLSYYADATAAAIRHHAAGEPDRAARSEASAAAYRDRLPDWADWPDRCTFQAAPVVERASI